MHTHKPDTDIHFSQLNVELFAEYDITLSISKTKNRIPTVTLTYGYGEFRVQFNSEGIIERLIPSFVNFDALYILSVFAQKYNVSFHPYFENPYDVFGEEAA